MSETTRRQFLRAAARGGTIAALGDLAFLAPLGPVSAAEARLDPRKVRMEAGIEPVVRLVEETPRERLVEEVAARIRRGLSYREVLTALLLAGVRNLRPRPVGFKFHAVLAVNSAHLASLAAADGDRWLPLFWALDLFKGSQATAAAEGDWALGPVDESAVPPPARAREALIEALDAWDEPAADAAAAGLARSAAPAEAFDLLVRYGARDFRDIGHKAIFAANAFRALATIGWRHCEPVLRSLVFAFLEHGGGGPPRGDDDADRPWRRNLQLAARFPDGWRGGKPSAEAVGRLLRDLRHATADEACDAIVDYLAHGVAPASVWDGLLAGASELHLRAPGIVALHAVTSLNALRHAFAWCGDEGTRRLLLLQAAAFLVLFRKTQEGRGPLSDVAIDALEPEGAPGTGQEAIEAVIAAGKADPAGAARKTLAFLRAGGSARDLAAAARRLVFLRGTDAHDYKFGAAVLEDAEALSPGWDERYLAASAFRLSGSADRETPLVARIRAALGGRAF